MCVQVEGIQRSSQGTRGIYRVQVFSAIEDREIRSASSEGCVIWTWRGVGDWSLDQSPTVHSFHSFTKKEKKNSGNHQFAPQQPSFLSGGRGGGKKKEQSPGRYSPDPHGLCGPVAHCSIWSSDTVQGETEVPDPLLSVRRFLVSVLPSTSGW